MTSFNHSIAIKNILGIMNHINNSIFEPLSILCSEQEKSKKTKGYGISEELYSIAYK